MEPLENLIDPTNFGTVRRDLHHARSPLTSVLLVQFRHLLPAVAQALLAQDGRSDEGRRQQWTRWLGSGAVRLGTHRPTHRYEADLETIPHDAHCHVLALPPVYLVCLRDYRATPGHPRPE